MWRLFVLLLLLLAVAASKGSAQSFSPPLPPEWLVVVWGRGENSRFTLAVYSAQWRNLLHIPLNVVSPSLEGRVTRTVRTGSQGALFETTYRLNRRWSLGLWYNPIETRVQESFLVAGVPVNLDFGQEADLVDLHLIYSAGRGLLTQVGHFREYGTLTIFSAAGRPSRDYTRQSWNVWVTQQIRGRWQNRLLVPFVSVGYHPSSDLDQVRSAMVGLTASLNSRLSLSGSVWRLYSSQSVTRTTAGLVYRF
jgi:hypothetical protein